MDTLQATISSDIRSMRSPHHVCVDFLHTWESLTVCNFLHTWESLTVCNVSSWECLGGAWSFGMWKMKSPLLTVAPKGRLTYVSLQETWSPLLQWLGPGSPTTMVESGLPHNNGWIQQEQIGSIKPKWLHYLKGASFQDERSIWREIWTGMRDAVKAVREEKTLTCCELKWKGV